MQFYFIRHAQSENNRMWELNLNDTGRTEDPDLSDLGREQTFYLARFLAGPEKRLPPTGRRDAQNRAGFDLTHLYCSPMLRAVATAMAIGKELGLPVRVWEDLHECGGIYLADAETGERVGLPGRRASYYQEHYPELILPEDFAEEGWWNGRSYEEHEERLLRARRVWDGLLARHGETEDRVAVVSHGAFFNYLMGTLFETPLPEERFWMAMSNAAVTRVDFAFGEIMVVYSNRLEFMPRELIS